ncbi:MAG: RDD family protein [Flavobacteriales bacterium]|jgi:hypothetical protein
MLKKLLPILLALMTLYTLYVYYDSVIHIQYITTDEMGMEKEVDEYGNPLLEIFLGRAATDEDGSFRVYHPLNRVGTLLHTTMAILLLAGVVRWFLKRGQRNTWLVFTLLTYFWGKVSHIAVMLMGKLVHALEVQSLMPYFSSGAAWYWILFGVLYLAAVAAAIKGLLDGQTEERSALPAGGIASFQGMRAVHMVVDRMFLLFLGSQYFLMNYVQISLSSSRRFSEFDPEYYQLIGSLHWIFATVLAYFLTERLFGMSPGKVLTGLRVVKADSNAPVSTGSALGRSLARLIPFENFSALGHRMWHDSITGTQLVYAGASHWLARQSRIIITASVIMLVFSAWVVVGLVTDIADIGSRSGYDVSDHSKLPYLVVYAGFIPFWFIFAGWMAAVANGADNLISETHRDRGAYLLEVWAWLIPFAHFIMPGRTLYTLRENIALKYPDHPGIEQLERAERTFKVLFHIFYVLFVFAVIALLSDNSRFGIISAAVISIPGLICLFAGMIAYARAVGRLEV